MIEFWVGSEMLKLADILVYSADDNLQLVVEVKNKTEAGPDWAAQMRRNLFAHSILPQTPFFLLALPDRLYLWKDGASSTTAAPPDYEIDSLPFFAPYLMDTNLSLDDLSESSLELIVKSWLNDIINADLTEQSAASHEKWLFDSGLYRAIENGSVKSEFSS